MKKHILRTFTLALVACFLLAFPSCTRESRFLLDLQDHIYSDGEFNFVRWAGYTWAVIPLGEVTEQYRFDIMLVDAEEADYLFMPRISELLQEYVDQDTGEIEETCSFHAIAYFIDDWIGSGKWTQEPI